MMHVRTRSVEATRQVAAALEPILLPGDVILTGTPSGVGPIESDDTLEVRIQGLAPLVNSVK